MERWTDQSDHARHQSVALAQFRMTLETNLTEETSAAAFALSAVMSSCSMARACAVMVNAPPPRAFTMDQVAETIILTQVCRCKRARTKKPLMIAMIGRSRGH
jgi:hypothetical protein